MTDLPWFEHLAYRYQVEIAALNLSGLAYQETKSDGQLVIRVTYPHGDTEYELIATYPPSYPYFPFSLRSPNLPIGRHLGSNLQDICVLGDVQNKWDSGADTLAGIIRSQIPLVLNDHDLNSGGDLNAKEALRPSGFAHYLPDTRVFLGDWSLPPDSTHGTMKLALEADRPPAAPLRGAVIKCEDHTGRPIAAISYGLLDALYAGNSCQKLDAKWVFLPQAPVTPDEATQAVTKVIPSLKIPRFNKGPDIVGIAYPEESSVGAGVITNWMFLVRVKVKSPAGNQHAAYLARAQYLTQDIMRARSPRTAPLAIKKVLLVGLGAIGSPIAFQLARAGIGELRLLDFDVLETGNLTRWLPTLGHTGLAKTFAAGHLLAHSYPFTNIVEVVGKTVDGHLVRPRVGSAIPAEHAAFLKALEGVDLIIDATAERAVSHFISDLAKSKGIAYLWATATPGAWGGVVGRVVPSKTEGCWQCYQWFINEKSEPRWEKQPPSEDDESSMIQPKGCFHTTFTGSGFDLDQVSTMATRLAVATLCIDEEGGYPDFDWNVAILSSWDKVNNKPTLPEWKPFQLHRYPDCPNHE